MYKNKSIMIQGTASSVGKSILCTALCRIFTEDGYNVNPFKSQNMSLNSYTTEDGHEMGRAQVMQAEAARKIPSSKMNPILLKPTSDRRSQVIFKGKVHKTMDAVEYFQYKPQLKNEITSMYNELQFESDIVVIEGAGSPAEINLNHEDFVNMGMAKIANSPVILVGDIDKGGVFAALAGTLLLLTEEEKARVKGVIINKFRGSYEILEPGLKMLEDIIKIPVLGVIPYFKLNIDDEDSTESLIDLCKNKKGDIDIAVIRLPYMSNFTDINSLVNYEDVAIRFVNKKEEFGSPDLIIIPGTKSTVSDLNFLKASGLFEKVIGSYEKVAYVFGICGGFQMLGREILDPNLVESKELRVQGLSLLNTSTTFDYEKTTVLSSGTDSLFNEKIRGYEIHMGQTKSLANEKTFININKRGQEEILGIDGVISNDERVFGTYLHGVFDNSSFTRKFLNKIRVAKGLKEVDFIPEDYFDYKDKQYDELAKIVRENLDIKKIYEIMKL